MKTKSRLYIISGPSGAGKSTLCKKVLKKYPDIIFSISYTTRKPRFSETEGKDYFFIGKEEFVEGIEKGRWLEWAEVHDNYYGTSFDFVKQEIDKNNDILFDIDVLGATQLIEFYPHAVMIFIMPPSNEEVKKRLRKRGADDINMIKKRIDNARKEIEKKEKYEYIIINHRLDKAFAELCEIINEKKRI